MFRGQQFYAQHEAQETPKLELRIRSSLHRLSVLIVEMDHELSLLPVCSIRSLYILRLVSNKLCRNLFSNIARPSTLCRSSSTFLLDYERSGNEFPGRRRYSVCFTSGENLWVMNLSIRSAVLTYVHCRCLACASLSSHVCMLSERESLYRNSCPPHGMLSLSSKNAFKIVFAIRTAKIRTL